MSKTDFIKHVQDIWELNKHSRVGRPKSVGDAIYYVNTTLQKNLYFSCSAFGEGSATWRNVDKHGAFSINRSEKS